MINLALQDERWQGRASIREGAVGEAVSTALTLLPNCCATLGLVFCFLARW